MVDTVRIRDEFARDYGGAARIFSAPGRVNLIGEHTDYNDGFVLPLAIVQRTYVAAAARTDGRVRVRSVDAPGEHVFELARPGQPRRGAWYDYVEGVARVLTERGARLGGADLFVHSEVPRGAGLSSSAALEVAIGYALLSLAGLSVDKRALALAAQAAEHAWVGTLCGIMDQYVSALAEPGHALLVDCRSLATQSVPIDPAEVSVVVCDSGVKHSLATSEYNSRRLQCEQGLALLRHALKGRRGLEYSDLEYRALRDITEEELAACEGLLPDVLWRRCRHIVTENARTCAAADRLRAGDFAEVGALMNSSHDSLRDDYEVSCPELDVLVEAARAAGALGSRMTGGGFGGCTVSLVEPAMLDQVTSHLADVQERRLATRPRLFVTRASGGVREEPGGAHREGAPLAR